MSAVYAGSSRTQRRRRRSGSRRPHVEVRSGRKGRALRVDGTFASWYAPGGPVTGSVWDALAAPVVLLPRSRRRRVLILGLGGGSAARVIRAVAPAARIVGVERDPEVIAAARRWFDLDELGIEVIEGDAFEVLRRSRRHFDLVLEDVFVGSGRALRKPDWLPSPGLALAAARLSRGGILASNAIEEAAAMTRSLRRAFPATLGIGIRDYDNRILVGGPAGLSGRLLRAAVTADPVLRPAAANLSFRTL